jgi:hypothetical protein
MTLFLNSADIFSTTGSITGANVLKDFSLSQTGSGFGLVYSLDNLFSPMEKESYKPAKYIGSGSIGLTYHRLSTKETISDPFRSLTPKFGNIIVDTKDYLKENLDFDSNIITLEYIRPVFQNFENLEIGIKTGVFIADFDFYYSLKTNFDNNFAAMKTGNSTTGLVMGFVFSAKLEKSWKLDILMDYRYGSKEILIGPENLEGSVFKDVSRAASVNSINSGNPEINISGWILGLGVSKKI